MRRLVAICLILCMFLGLCALTAVSETQPIDEAADPAMSDSLLDGEGMKTYTLGRAAFQLPGNVYVNVQDALSRFFVYFDRYAMTCYSVDYAAAGIDFTLGSGVLQIDNLGYLLKLFYNVDNHDMIEGWMTACNVVDIGMPDGEPVVRIDLNSQGAQALAHCFNGTGFVLIGEYMDDIPAEELFQALQEIALTFRLDGLTGAEMAALPVVVTPVPTPVPAVTEKPIKTAAPTAAPDVTVTPAPTAAPAATAVPTATPAPAADDVKMVVITAASGRIRAVADISGDLIKTAYQGESYELIREIDDWYIINVDGRRGYIHKGVSAIQ